MILIASGSEVSLAVAAYEQLTGDGIAARVVSMPSMHLFNRQPQSYRDQVLPPAVAVSVAVERPATLTWDRWVGPTGKIIGMDIFGASAPLKALQAKYGFTVDAVVTAARAQLGTAGTDRGSTSSEAPIGTHPTDPE